MHLFSGNSLCVYRVPGEKYPRLLTEDVGAVRLIFDLKELNGQRGFVIAPFRIDKSCPIVLIQSDRTGQPLPREIVAEEEQDLQSYPEESFHTLCTGKYATCFHTFIEALRDATFDKLVLSRSLTIGKNPEFSPSAVFRAACQRYIHSYIYLCYTPQTGVWLGSTPEIILSAKKMNGTQLPWQELNLCRMVNFRKYGMTKTVRSRIMWRPISVRQLLSLGIRSTESGPYRPYAGALFTS